MDKIIIEKSCANCLYGELHIDTGYWEFPDEYDIVCNYPNEGNFGKDVNEINYSWEDYDLIEIAEACDTYTTHHNLDLDYQPIEEEGEE